MPVLLPASVAIGATLPDAPGANVTTVLSLPLETTKSPLASSVTSVGTVTPVLVPPMVRIGLTLPEAPGANTRIAVVPLELKHRPQLAAYKLPLVSNARPSTPVRPVLLPEIVLVGAMSPFASTGYTVIECGPGVGGEFAT